MAGNLSQSVSTASGAGRGGALDALRFVASLLIVLYHYGTEAPVVLSTFHPVFERGYLATDFFLILSGFVLGRAYGGQVLSGKIGWLGFLKKRITRVWPAQLVVLAALAAVVALATAAGVSPDNPENFSARAMLMQLFLAQSWGLPGGTGWNHQSWSLSALLVCYAVFPLLWPRVSRLANSWALLGLGLGAVVAGDLLCLGLLGHHVYDLDLQFGAVRAVPLFLLGVCIARIVEQNRPTVPVAWLTAGLSLVAVAAIQVAGRFDLLSIVAIALVVLSFGRLPVRRPSRLIETGAKLSFALFITHALTGLVWFGALGVLESRLALPGWALWGLWSLSLPIALAAAWVFHRMIDEPLQRWLAPAARRKRVEATATPATA